MDNWKVPPLTIAPTDVLTYDGYVLTVREFVTALVLHLAAESPQKGDGTPCS